MRRLIVILFILACTPAAYAQAPVLSVTGETLHWTAVEGATRYRAQDCSSATECNFSLYWTAPCCEATPTVSKGTTEAFYRVEAWEPLVGEWSNIATVHYGFASSIDTMKLSKDKAASEGFTSSDGQAVDLAATTHAAYITDNTQLEYPSVMLAWANRIHADGKHVWFRLGVAEGGSLRHGDEGDGYPTYAPGYLTRLHEVMRANPSLVKAGDILDGDAEAENSSWWANHYGCGVQAECSKKLCNEAGTNTPCAPVLQFNHFLKLMTEQENIDLAAMGVSGVNTRVHSTDPGTATHQLEKSTVEAMGNIITVDAYPDELTESPSEASSKWKASLESWRKTWEGKGLKVSILVGEWGYSNGINVSDAKQNEVVKAEVEMFPTVPYLIGTNYWVGPGAAGDGGYTQIFVNSGGTWIERPAAKEVQAFYERMGG